MSEYKLTLNDGEDIDVYADGVDVQESGAVNFYNYERIDEFASRKRIVRAFGPQHWKEVRKMSC